MEPAGVPTPTGLLGLGWWSGLRRFGRSLDLQPKTIEVALIEAAVLVPVFPTEISKSPLAGLRPHLSIICHSAMKVAGEAYSAMDLEGEGCQ